MVVCECLCGGTWCRAREGVMSRMSCWRVYVRVQARNLKCTYVFPCSSSLLESSRVCAGLMNADMRECVFAFFCLERFLRVSGMCLCDITLLRWFLLEKLHVCFVSAVSRVVCACSVSPVTSLCAHYHMCVFLLFAVVGVRVALAERFVAPNR